MAETLSLKELKAENEAEELETKEVKEPVQDEYIEVDAETEEPIKPKAVEDEPSKEEAEDVETEELEAWQQTEDNESDDSKPVIDSSGWKQQRLKTKALKAENREQSDELKALQAQVDTLTNQGKAPVVEAAPTLEQFDHDPELHQAALTEYLLNQIDKKIGVSQQTTQQTQQQAQAVKLQGEAVNRHYEQAEKLIQDKKITEDGWKKADGAIRQTLDSLDPGKGDQYADQLIALLNNSGEASGKVWYYLGNNKSALDKLTLSLQQDPSGMRASMYLGQLQRQATSSNRNKHSEAPKPAAIVKGDAPIALSKSQKAYSKMTDSQERISYKRAQKKAGVDVSKWK